MSYVRWGSPLIYVDGNSEDYIFPTSGEDGVDYIEDYGRISDSGFIDLLFTYWETKDTEFKDHLLKRLAERLNVKLRDKPLGTEERIRLTMENMKRFENETTKPL